MSGSSKSYYGTKAKQLESSLRRKLQQLTLLQEENARLLHKEKALQDAIKGVEGPLAITKEALVQAAAAAAAAEAASDGLAAASDGLAAASDGPAAAAHSGGSAHSLSQGGDSSSNGPLGCSSSGHSFNSATAAGRRSSSLPAATVASYRDTQALLGRLDERESTVQRSLQQLGGCTADGYNQLYTTQLLRAASSQPERVQAHLSMDKPQRLRFVSQTVASMALLLGKYDTASSSSSSLSTGSIREQLDALVDDLCERIVVCALWDPPQKYMSNCMVNVETHEFEPYPQGWWTQVVQGIGFTVEQKAAIKLVWDRVKAASSALTQEYEQLQQRLQQVHMQELQHNRQFEQEVRVLPFSRPVLPAARELCDRRQQQQQEQQQQQPQQQQEQCADLQLQQLHDAWMQEGDGDTAAAAAAAAAAGGPGCTPESLLDQLLAELQQASQQTQQQQQSACNSPAAQASAAPAGASVSLTSPPQSGGGAVQQQLSHNSTADSQGGVVSPAAKPRLAVTPGTHRSQLEEAEEVLLQAGSEERQLLERRMQAASDRIKTLHMCLALQLSNNLTKKQLAAMFVAAHPFIPEAFTLCSALDELDAWSQ